MLEIFITAVAISIAITCVPSLYIVVLGGKNKESQAKVKERLEWYGESLVGGWFFGLMSLALSGFGFVTILVIFIGLLAPNVAIAFLAKLGRR